MPSETAHHRGVLLILLLAVCVPLQLKADLFSPNRQLQTIHTEHFSIIFPDESRSAAEYLASFADTAYREVAGHLATKATFKRFPVVITPDSEEINGYFSNYPYNRIVIFQAPVDAGTGLDSFNNDLYKIFYHEVTHAVSLSINGPIQSIITTIFGAPASLVYLRTPLNLIEGVTVAFESLDGFGRAADPFAGALLRQDILEGRWKDFYQTGGAYSNWPFGQLYYLYGGYFSRMLIERYGMDKYAELWQRNSSDNILKGLDRFLFIKGHFYDTYGITIEEAWQQLEADMSIRVPVYMTPLRLRGPAYITALTGGDNRLFYAVGLENAVFSRDIVSGRERRLFDIGYVVTRLSWHQQTRQLLVSTSRTVDNLQRLEIRIWDSETGRQRVLKTGSLREAAWAGANGIVAIQVDGYQTNLVLLTEDSAPQVLLEGSENVSYSSPLATKDGNSIYVLVRENGKQSILKIDFNSAVPPQSSDMIISKLRLPEEISWLRYLSITSDEKLLASWDDDKLPRLVEIDVAKGSVRWQQVPISGGIHSATEQAGEMYHLGRFSTGISLVHYPGEQAALAFRYASVDWVDASYLKLTESVYKKKPNQKTKPYNALFWLLPRFWQPTFSFDNNNIKTGAAFYIADPVERLQALLAAEWNVGMYAPDFLVQLQYNGFSPALNLLVQDGFTRLSTNDGATYIERASQAEFNISQSLRNQAAFNFGWSAQTGLYGKNQTAETAALYTGWSELTSLIGLSASVSKFNRALDTLEASSGFAIRTALNTILFHKPQKDFFVQLGLSGNLNATALAMENRAFAILTAKIDGRDDMVWPAVQFSSWQLLADSSVQLFKADMQQRLGLLYYNQLTMRVGGNVAAYSDSAAPFSAWPTPRLIAYARIALNWTPLAGALAIQLRRVSSLDIRYNFITELPEISFNLTGGL